MKKIISILSCALALTLVSSCNWFELDNQEGWDASVEGQILDAGTNQPIQFAQGFSAITVVEKGWKAQTNQSWAVKNNGTYVNKLTFAGKYEFDTRNSNFKADIQEFQLKKGANTQDFYVTPYLRIKNPQISMSGKVINATFDVEVAVPGTTVSRVEVCVYPDRWVRHSSNNCANDPYAYVVNPKDTHFSLSVDPDRIVKQNGQDIKVNAAEFQYDRPHYIRIAALGKNASNTSSAYNYSPVYKVDLKTGDVTEVTDW